MFDTLTIREAPVLTFLRRATTGLLSVFLLIGGISTYRAMVQVYRLDLFPAETVLQTGSTISYEVVISGRTTVDVQLELIQDNHSQEI